MAKRRNRKINKKLSVNVVVGTHLGAVIAFLFLMVILNLLASSSCQQLMKRIGAQERELVRLEDARNREAMRWEELKTTDKVEAALLKHGLSMRAPRPEQNVLMKSNGQPYPGQLSVAKRMAANTVNVASVAPRQSRKRGR